MGPAGPTGPAGTNGTNGTNGAQGPAGPAGPAGTTRVPFFGSSYFASNATRYIGMGESDANEAKVAIPTPVAGSIGGLQVRTYPAPNTGGNTRSYTFTVFVNGSATASNCTITNTAQSCADLVNNVAVSVGDRITLQSAPTNGPTAVSVTWSYYINQ